MRDWSPPKSASRGGCSSAAPLMCAAASHWGRAPAPSWRRNCSFSAARSCALRCKRCEREGRFARSSSSPPSSPGAASCCEGSSGGSAHCACVSPKGSAGVEASPAAGALVAAGAKDWFSTISDMCAPCGKRKAARTGGSLQSRRRPVTGRPHGEARIRGQARGTSSPDSEDRFIVQNARVRTSGSKDTRESYDL